MPAAELLGWAIETYADRFALVTSFQAEGMVLLDMAVRIAPRIRVITVDTGRLPDETHRMIDTVERRYGLRVEVALPEPAEVDNMVSRHGLDLFFNDVPYRKLCCHIRKVRPLENKLRSLDAWAVGLRRSQAETRAGLAKVEEVEGRIKLSPLADWTSTEVEEYLQKHDVPRHPLYSQGYASIGCAPCTRAIRPGEGERAGRWWWESDSDKECGIHFTPEGRAARQVDVLIDEVLSAVHHA